MESPSERKRVRRTPEQKIALVLRSLKALDWSLADLLYHMFRVEDGHEAKIHRELPHANAVSQFLRGRTRHTLGEILEHLWRDPAGRPKDDEEREQMYSPAIHYKDRRIARPALSAFAVQIVGSKVLRERNTVVRSAHGLHGSEASNRRGGRRALSWSDVGSHTVEKVTEVLREYQPLTWHIVESLVSPKPRRRNGVLAVRKARPANVVRS